MIAVIELGGKQYTVETGTTLVVDHQHVEAGKTFDVGAMLIATPDAKTVHVGIPLVEGSKVTLKVEEHFKGDKVRVFKMKAKKHYSRTIGFRPMQSRVTVTAIA